MHHGERAARSHPAAPPAPVGAVGIVVTFLAAQVGGGLVIAALLAALPSGTSSGSAAAPWAVRLTYGLSSLMLLLAGLTALRLSRRREEAASAPLWRWPGGGVLLLGVAAGLGLKLAGDLVTLAERPLLGPAQSNNPLVLYPHAFSQPAVLGVLLLAVGVVAPLAEELFFRGLLYGWLRGRLGVLPATGVAAVLFSLAHHQVGLFLPLAVVGAGLCLLYERSGTLWTPAAAHAAVNASSLLLALWLR